jgi:hypothetical protein
MVDVTVYIDLDGDVDVRATLVALVAPVDV